MWVGFRSFALSLVGLVCLAMTPSMALAQAGQNAPETQIDRLIVDANELVYDNDANTVTAKGDAKLYYKGKILEADRVTYIRKTGRVIAEGHARLTDPGRQVVFGDRFELTDDFKDGFIQSLRLETEDKTHFSSPRAERIDGNVTVFDHGIYTACDACKDDPSKPPLWQVKAKRIIHNKEEAAVYYEDATFEVGGVPAFYLPYFSSPDGTVQKRSGFLPATYFASTALGAGFSLPYFFNLAPNYDLTLTPTYYSRQGLMAQVEWRHRLENGTYSLSMAGINQNDPSAFLPSPNGPGDQDFRGYVETIGKFKINQNWDWGWDIALISDKWFLQNYRIPSPSVTRIGTLLRESTSTTYLTGKGDDSLFDIRGYYFKSLLPTDLQDKQGFVLPVIDYDRRFKGPGEIGGEIWLNTNFTNVSRLEADFGKLNVSANCDIVPTSADCFLRGLGGNYTRLSSELGWRRTFIDPFGQSWTPFSSVRADIAGTTLFTDSVANQSQTSIFDAGNEARLRAQGTLGVTYRYPFLALSTFGTQIFEPIVQLISRADEMNVGHVPNEDAQSLVFDDTNLFSVSKFSGYDRSEGGVRMNIGGQYTLNFDQGAYLNVLAGQSIQLAGLNSYESRGLALEGTQSGLDKPVSDYVARAQFVPSANYSLSARGRFDDSDLEPKRIEVEAQSHFGRLTTGVLYANYAPQPLAGIDNRREGVSLNGAFELTPNWSINGAALFSLSRYLSDPSADRYYAAGYSAGLGYRDECTEVSLNYIGKEAFNDGTSNSGETIWLRIVLRSLGSAQVRRSLTDTSMSQ